jgi:hypothetical protein
MHGTPEAVMAAVQRVYAIVGDAGAAYREELLPQLNKSQRKIRSRHCCNVWLT